MLSRLSAVFDRANAIALSLSREEQDAFFQMILMKVHAAWYINASFYCADRSRLCYERGAMQAADAYVDFSREMDDRKRRMLYRYNHEICGGKWEGILTPESFSPPPTVLYPAGKPALRIAEPGLLAVAPEGEVEFWAYGQREKLVDIYNQGYGSVRYELVLPVWLEARVERRMGRSCHERRGKALSVAAVSRERVSCSESVCSRPVCDIDQDGHIHAGQKAVQYRTACALHG